MSFGKQRNSTALYQARFFAWRSGDKEQIPASKGNKGINDPFRGVADAVLVICFVIGQGNWATVEGKANNNNQYNMQQTDETLTPYFKRFTVKYCSISALFKHSAHT